MKRTTDNIVSPSRIESAEFLRRQSFDTSIFALELLVRSRTQLLRIAADLLNRRSPKFRRRFCAI